MSKVKDELLHELFDKFIKYSDNEEAHAKVEKKKGSAQANVTKAENALFNYIMDNYCKKPFTLDTSHEIMDVYNRLKSGEVFYY